MSDSVEKRDADLGACIDFGEGIGVSILSHDPLKPGPSVGTFSVPGHDPVVIETRGPHGSLDAAAQGDCRPTLRRDTDPSREARVLEDWVRGDETPLPSGQPDENAQVKGDNQWANGKG